MISYRCCAALLTLCSAAAKAADGGVLWWDVPHALAEARVPEVMFASDYPVTMRAVKSTEKLEALIRFFVFSFEKAGLYLPPASDMPDAVRHSSLTALDTHSLISYTVIFQPNPDRTTTVFISETYLNERRPASAAPATFTAIFPGARSPIVTASEGTRTLSYFADAAPAEVDGFYREVLLTSGYQQQEPGVFTRGGEELRVLASQEGAKAHVTVFMRLK